MVEHREKVDTEGRGLGHSWADDNVVRGEPGVDFEKRRVKFPFGDDPRGREIDFEDTTGAESYGSTRNPVVRAFRGKAPLEGQNYESPSRVAGLQRVTSLRPELPSKTTADAANAALQESQRHQLRTTNFQALFPSVSISSPAPGTTFAPGSEITIIAPATDMYSLFSATLEIDNQGVDRRVIDRRDQGSTPSFDFRFIYTVSPTRVLGPMTITVRAFNFTVAAQGIIADDALSTTNIRSGIGTLDGSPGSSTSAADYQKLFNETGFLRTPEGVSSITVNIV
jgi:hypothetical protein